MKSNIGIAKICHKANMQYCLDNHLPTTLEWDELEPTLRSSIINGVAQVIANPKVTPAEMHEKWIDYKRLRGWKFAKVLSVKNKTHPNLVPFNKLSKDEQAKDKLFIKTVKAEMKK